VNIDIAQLYIILAIFFFILPVAVYTATAEFRDHQVYWWCIGGLGTGFAFLLFGLRNIVPDVFSFYIAHVFLRSDLVFALYLSD
jgi:hypothetical protein